MKYLDENGLLYLVQKIKTWLGNKVDKEEGKGLSTNDYTTDEKNKLKGIEDAAQVNKLETIKINGTAQSITNKAVDITVPTKISDLSNDSKYQTESQVGTSISNALVDYSTTEQIDEKLTDYVSNDTYTTGLAGKVDKVTGKGLSTNDFTTAEKNKLATLENYTLPEASADTLGGVKVGAGLAVTNGVLSATGGGTADAVEWENVLNKPSNVSAFENDAKYQTDTEVEKAITDKGYQTSAQVESAIAAKGYQTANQVNSAISEAIAGVTQFQYEKVSALPATGTKGVIYLVASATSSSTNVYDEYIWIEADSKFEFIGTTAVDLSGYVQETDLVAITNAEIDNIITAA